MEMNYTLVYSEIADDDSSNKNVQFSFSNEGDINSVLGQVRDFLQAAGFTYVTDLIAVCGNGIELSSN